MNIQNKKKIYEAVLFDLDGVLADTRLWVVSAYEHTAAAHGLVVCEDDLASLFGRPLDACYRVIGGAEEVGPWLETHRGYQWQNMHLVTVFEGVYELLDALCSRGMKCAIVTGRNHKSAGDTLERLSLAHYFDAIVTADQTTRHKPDPEPVQRALDHLGIRAEDALMVGDAEADICAGRAAGCDTAGALYGFIGASLKALSPTYLLDRPLDLLAVLE